MIEIISMIEWLKLFQSLTGLNHQIFVTECPSSNKITCRVAWNGITAGKMIVWRFTSGNGTFKANKH